MQTIQERFWSKVEKTPTCWLWTGSCNPKGYGQFRVGKKKPGAHRVAYEWLVGPIPEGMQLDHLCRVRNCVNSDHLEVVTNLENNRRGERANRTHCKQGHEYNEENTYRHPDGWRDCRACQREYGKQFREKRRNL